MEKKRSVGVTILAWFFLIGFFGGVLTLPRYKLPHEIIYNVVSSIYCLIAGWGLLRLLDWARIFTIIMAIVTGIYNKIYSYIYLRDNPFWAQNKKLLYGLDIFSLLWIAFIIYFLTRPKVKEQFK